jgi:opacity protein-like surface antigen
MGEKSMKKHLLILSLMTLPMMAEDYFSFIGLNTGYKQVQLDSAYSTEDTTHTTVSLRIGTQTRKWRASLSMENGNKYRAFDINFDVIPFDEFFGTPKIRPYIGLSTTLLSYDNESIPETDGYGFGGNLGLILYAGENVDVDIAYQYSTINNIEGVDDMQGVRLGIHYFY